MKVKLRKKTGGKVVGKGKLQPKKRDTKNSRSKRYA